MGWVEHARSSEDCVKARLIAGCRRISSPTANGKDKLTPASYSVTPPITILSQRRQYSFVVKFRLIMRYPTPADYRTSGKLQPAILKLSLEASVVTAISVRRLQISGKFQTLTSTPRITTSGQYAFFLYFFIHWLDLQLLTNVKKC